MKGQMFVVAMVFLVGLMFIAQQVMFQYTALDISEPMRLSDAHVTRSLTDMVNRTIKTNMECSGSDDSFETYLEELESVLEREETGRIYIIQLAYSLDCSFWDNQPPDENPLNISIRVISLGMDTTGQFKFYHSYEYADVFPPNIQNGQISPLSGVDGTIFTISAEITDSSGVNPSTTIAHIQDPDETDIDTELLHDDGINGDLVANDDNYTAQWNSTGYCPSGECSYFVDITACDNLGNCGEAENL